MASNSTGNAITPKAVGMANSRSIAIGTIGQQQAHMQGLTTGDDAGVTFAQYLARWAASGGPLWATKQTPSGQPDYFIAEPTTGARRTGTVHAFRHLATEGKRTGCVGGHNGRGSSCDATAPNKGDNSRRWRADGSSFGTVANESNERAVLRAAHAAIDARVAHLYGMGFGMADIAATASIAQYVEMLGYVVPSKAGSKASAKPAGKATSKAAPRKRTATVRASSIAPTVEPAEGSDDDSDREPTDAELAAIEA